MRIFFTVNFTNPDPAIRSAGSHGSERTEMSDCAGFLVQAALQACMAHASMLREVHHA